MGEPREIGALSNFAAYRGTPPLRFADAHMLWFNNQAEEAVNLYTNLFENSKINNVFRQPHRPGRS